MFASLELILKMRPTLNKYLPEDFSDWSTYLAEAHERFVYDLDTHWYRKALKNNKLNYTEHLFDVTRLDATNPGLQRAEAYLTLSIVYEAISKDVKDDQFFEKALYYLKRYNEVLQMLCESGLLYDFNGDGYIAETEFISSTTDTPEFVLGLR